MRIYLETTPEGEPDANDSENQSAESATSAQETEEQTSPSAEQEPTKQTRNGWLYRKLW